MSKSSEYFVGLARTVRKARRKRVKRTGRKIIHLVAGFTSRQSLVNDQPVYSSGTFPFLAPIEAKWTTILDELKVILEERPKLRAFHQISPDQKHISIGDRWKVFILYGFGVASRRNCARCPETARLLRKHVAGTAVRMVLYSLPGLSHATPSRHHEDGPSGPPGPIVPRQWDKCVMQVDHQVVGWEPGKAFVFDDFYHHEVWNNTDEEGVALIFDFDSPMRSLGKVMNSALMWGIKQTAYFKDADRNLKNWDERLEAAVLQADEMLDDVLPTD
jgi:beta-hydroxylase